MADVFRQVLRWLDEQPIGCPLAGELGRIIEELTGKIRFTVCFVGADSLCVGSRDAEATGYCYVRSAWPVLSQRVEIVIAIYDEEHIIYAQHRARMRAGPSYFHVVSRQEFEHEELAHIVAQIPQEEITRVRRRMLHGELAALARKYPDRFPVALSAVLSELAAESLAMPAARVAVLGPDERQSRSVADQLGHQWTLVNIARGADLAIVVAPQGGWLPDHVSLLDHAFRRTGRLISTAPLPYGCHIPAVIVSQCDMYQWDQLIHKQLAHEIFLANHQWERGSGAHLVQQKRINKIRRHLRELDYKQLKARARQHGLALARIEIFAWCEIVLLSIMMCCGLARLGLPWHISGVCCVVVTSMRVYGAWRLAKKTWMRSVVEKIGERYVV
ncbi:hypothetical protein EML15_05155 [Corynebacterium sp. sy017]|uniref:hypothetical protein n=1 Tax=unclassified Corynebacterium TaxID=2624378 RepID=UPI001185BC39|nr:MULTISPECIES: hypothetical protein [unclassified Corynebacterium]MBP3088533.1 hypothetical protein [Corynebacterium sp. sy017]TSD91835.1 hypothetical protein ELY17_05155 [Corynebacterium sp. SY003]